MKRFYAEYSGSIGKNRLTAENAEDTEKRMSEPQIDTDEWMTQMM